MTMIAAQPETKLAIKDVARQIVADGLEAEPAIRAAYLFPSSEQIRLVYLDPTTSPSRDKETIWPFYFGANSANGIPYPSAIALIRPEEKENLQPPMEWGTWDDAEALYEI